MPLNNLRIMDPEDQVLQLMELNQFTRSSCDIKLLQYNMKHCSLMGQYMQAIASRLNIELDTSVSNLIAWTHDLFKEVILEKKKKYKEFRGITIPQDINRYIRLNMPILESLGLDLYFNSDIQLHPQAAAIFMYDVFKVTDPEIIYPIIFHSCPIMPVYRTLDSRVQQLVDIALLSDKLSSNHIRIQLYEMKLPVDLELSVFGETGKEFNYTTGLLLARLIGQGNSRERNSKEATEFYFNRAKQRNPLIRNSVSMMKGAAQIWPRRKSPIVNLL